jgi:SAM-dependent methyltransferase
MKNVRGKEIYNTNEEKLIYYDAQCDFVIPGPKQFFLGKTAVKDDYFDEILIPFCVQNKIQSVLDVGAGYGRYAAKFINNKILDVLAVEITPRRTEYMRTTLDLFGYEVVKTECLDVDVSLPERVFDFIFMSDIVEHLERYRPVWRDCLAMSRYVYALIPKENSWSWSDDHVTVFNDEKVLDLLSLSSGIIRCDVIDFDDANSWYTILVKGNL